MRMEVNLGQGLKAVCAKIYCICLGLTREMLALCRMTCSTKPTKSDLYVASYHLIFHYVIVLFYFCSQLIGQHSLHMLMKEFAQ